MKLLTRIKKFVLLGKPINVIEFYKYSKITDKYNIKNDVDNLEENLINKISKLNITKHQMLDMLRLYLELKAEYFFVYKAVNTPSWEAMEYKGHNKPLLIEMQ